MTLTANGAILLRHAVQILQSVNHAVAELKTQDISISGRVSFGLPGTAAGVLATVVIRHVRRKYPNVLLTILENSVHGLVHKLERGEVDLAILVNQLDRTSLDVVPVAMEDFCLYGLAEVSDGSKTLDWADISRLPLLLSGPSTTSREFIDQAARASGVRLTPVAEIDAIHLLKDAVLGGLGFAILPRSACREGERDSFWLRDIHKPSLQALIAVASSKVRLVTQAQEAVRCTIMEVCRDLVEKGVWSPAPGNAK